LQYIYFAYVHDDLLIWCPVAIIKIIILKGANIYQSALKKVFPIGYLFPIESGAC
jgi:hypothetical protein